MARPTVLGPVRHACVACGGGCFGTDVPVAASERAGIAASAEALGVADPFDGPHLRKVQNRCVFLGDERRCRLHTSFGPEAKPAVCRQYPLIGRQVGLDVRLAVDPGCLHAWRSWETGPEAADGVELAVSRGGQPMLWNGPEQALVQWIDPKRRSVADLFAALGDDASPTRLARGLVEARIGPRIAHPNTAQSLRESLAAVVDVLEELDPDAPPPVRVPEALDRWTVEVVRRMVWLRLPSDLPPGSRALGALAGALVCGWAHEDAEGYGPALAAWTRVVRTAGALPFLVAPA